jgi:hypothetical protein
LFRTLSTLASRVMAPSKTHIYPILSNHKNMFFPSPTL